MHIPKTIVDDPTIFLNVGRILDAMLNLVSPMNSLLTKYKASIDTISSGAISKKVTFKEGTSTYLQVTKKESMSKPKVVEKEASAKSVLETTRNFFSKKSTKDFTYKSIEIGFVKAVEKVIEGVMKSKKINMKAKPLAVVI